MKLNYPLLSPAPPETPDLSYNGVPAASYNPAEHGDLEAFEASAAGRETQRQITQGTNKLANFLHVHRPVATNVRLALLRQYAERAARGSKSTLEGDFQDTIASVYGPGKQALDMICADIDNKNVTIDTRLSHVENLADGIELCGPGAVNALVSVASDLRSATEGLPGSVKQRWAALLRQTVQDFAQQRHGHLPEYVGNETHYAQAYLNGLAEFGATPNFDQFAGIGISTEDFIACYNRVAAIRPESLIRQMADSCLQEVRARYAQYCDRPLNLEEFAAITKDHKEVFKDDLKNKYGPIDITTLLSEESEADSYRLIDNPTLLMRAITRNLRDAGLIEKPKGEHHVAGGRASGWALRRAGDGFLRKDWQDGDVTRRPVQVSDLAEAWTEEAQQALGATLMLAALANTQDPAQLAALPAEKV